MLYWKSWAFYLLSAGLAESYNRNTKKNGHYLRPSWINSKGRTTMAIRSVFVSKDYYPYFEEIQVDFDWFPGFALSQKRKSQISLHQNFLHAYPNEKVLEISSASLYSLGSALSAMHLHKRTAFGVTTVESAFQSSRIYDLGNKEIGPFHEYLFLSGRECKKKVKELSRGMISKRYLFEGLSFSAPEHNISLFYNYLYLNALCEEENRNTASRLLCSEYTAFTDLATRSLNCQARAAAIFIALVHNDLINEVRQYDSYLRLFRTKKDGSPINDSAFDRVQLLDKNEHLMLLSPVVPCVFSREKTEAYYEENCSGLSNKQTPENFLDLFLQK